MTVFLLLLGCSGGDSKERYTYAAEECERLGTVSFCLKAARSKHARPSARSLFYGKVCQAGDEDACGHAYRARTVSRSPYFGASDALGRCERDGLHCELARELAGAAGIDDKGRQSLDARLRALDDGGPR